MSDLAPTYALCDAIRPVQPTDRADLRAALTVMIICTKSAGHVGNHYDASTNVEWAADVYRAVDDLAGVRQRAVLARKLAAKIGPITAERFARDLEELAAEVERLRDTNGKLALTIQACPEGHHDANLAHARAERDQLRAEVERLRREQSVELANAEARADVLAEQVARLTTDMLMAVTLATHELDCEYGAECTAELTTKGRYGRLATAAIAEVERLRGANAVLEDLLDQSQANQLPDGGKWQYSYYGEDWWDERRDPRMRLRRRVGPAEPIPSQSDSEPRSDVDPADDTQTHHKAV